MTEQISAVGSAIGSRNRSVCVSSAASRDGNKADKYSSIVSGAGLIKTGRSILGKQGIEDAMSKASSTL